MTRLLKIAWCLWLVSAAWLPAAGQEWTEFKGGPAGDSVSQQDIKPPLSLLWKHSTDVNRHSLASPIVGDGRVYFTSGTKVYALDIGTGEQLWSYDLVARASGAPCYDNGVIYIGSFAKMLVAINASTGEKLWHYPVEASVTVAPLVQNGKVYFASDDQNVYCLKAGADGGNLVWKAHMNAAVTATPVSDGTYLFVLTRDTNLDAIELANGRLRWRAQVGSTYMVSTPAITDDAIIFGANDDVWAFQVTTGRRIWKSPTGGRVVSSPAVDKGVVYIGSGDGHLYALSLKNGVRLWAKDLGDPVLGSPTLTPSAVWIGTNAGFVYALNRSDGKVLWKYQIAVGRSDIKPEDRVPYNLTCAPAIVANAVYVQGDDGALYRFVTHGLDEAGPSIVQTKLEVPSTRGTRVAFDLDADNGDVPKIAVPGTPPIKVTIILNDEGSGINESSISATLNGKPVESTFDANKGELDVTLGDIPKPGSPVRTLPAEHYVLKVTVADWSGNTTVCTREFTVDNTLPPPEVKEEKKTGPGMEGAPGEIPGGEMPMY